MKDYYRILDVSPEATAEEIIRAYKMLVQQHHPDNYHLSDKRLANERMQVINEAYETLSDATQRRRYDREYTRYMANLPQLEKQQHRREQVRKLVNGFMLAFFLGLLLIGGMDALRQPGVQIVCAVLLLLLIAGLLQRKK